MRAPDGAYVAFPGTGRWFSLRRGVARAQVPRRDHGLAIGVGLLLMLAMLATLGPVLWSKDPLAVELSRALEPPSLEHPMGTDGSGRDIFARFNAGARISLLAGALVAATGAVIGGAIGVAAGFYGGWHDKALMRAMDAILAFPPLILAMAVAVGLGAGVAAAALGAMISGVPWYARIIRSEVLRLRSQPFVVAAQALGATRWRVIRRHILPHLLGTVFVQAAAVFVYAILTLAALGFVGLGAQVPMPEWGAMITDGLAFSLTGAWWVTVFPGLGVIAAAVGASLIADRAGDILDPRARGLGV